MSEPRFITCPGCGHENLEDQGETQVHSKNCSHFGAVQAQAAPVKHRDMDNGPILLCSGILLGGILGFALGHGYGDEQGRKAENQENTVFYQKLLTDCQERTKETSDFYGKETERNLKLWKLLNFIADASSLSQGDRDKIVRKTVELGLDK